MTGPLSFLSQNPQQNATQSDTTNPLSFLYNQQKPKVEKDIQDEGVLSTLGNYAKYIYNLANQPFPGFSSLKPDPKVRDYTLQTLQAMGQNIDTFAKSVDDVLSGKPSGATISNPFSLSALTKGTVMGMASIPISVAGALTNTKMGQDGEILPASPQEEAHNVQTTIALVASGAAASKVASMMAPTANIGSSYTGLLLKSAGQRAASGLAAGTAFGSIADMGDENQMGSIISNALAFATVGALWRPFKAANELGNTVIENREAQRTISKQSASELMATRGMQITPQDNTLDIAAKTKAFATSYDAIDAYIDANITGGKQTILEDVEPDVLDRLVAKYMPSARVSEGIYRPHPDVVNANTTYKGVKVNLQDPFDKATLLSENNPTVLQDLSAKTGLSEPEITSHRNYVKEQIKQHVSNPANISKPTPEEVTNLDKQSIQSGVDLLKGRSNGESFKDVNGKQWTVVGNSITDGQQALPMASELTQRLIGTDAKVNPNQPYTVLPKQNFSPEFGRELNSRVSIYRGANNTTLVSAYPMAAEPLDFFNKTGYLPHELVTWSGKPVTVEGFTDKGYTKVNDLATGRTVNVFPDELVRMPNGIDSEFYKADNGEQITKMGILNRENYLNNLYSQFKDKFLNVDEEPKEPFSTTMMKFGRSIGMKNIDDITDLGRHFYSRMVDDVVASMPKEEQEIYKRAMTNMTDWNNQIRNNAIKNLSVTLSNQNAALFPRGGGIYDIKDMESGKILHTVRSWDEATRFLNRSGQNKGLDLDGGNTSGQVLIGGTLQDSYTPVTTSWSRWFDTHVNIGKFAPYVAFTKSVVNAADQYHGTDFLPHFNALQTGQNFIQNLARGPLKIMLDKFNRAIELGDDVDDAGKMKVNDVLTSMKPEDIISKFQLNGVDVKHAQDIQGVGASNVIDYMHAVREASNYNPSTSNSFRINKAKIDKVGGYDPSVIATAEQLFNDPKGAAKIKLAQMLDHGEFVPENKLTNAETKYLNALKDAHESTFGGDSFYSYLPHSILAELTGQNPFSQHSPDFLRTINKLGSTPEGQTTTNPSLILHNFRLAAVRTAQIIPDNTAYFSGDMTKMISFNDIVDEAQKYITSIKDPKLNAIKQYYQNHLDDVKGIPDLSEQIGKAAQNALQQLYGKNYKSGDLVRFGNALIYSSLLGFRPAFAVRDLWNVYQNAANFEGSMDAALKIMGRTVSREYAQELIDKGIIANQKGMDLLQPGESVIDGMGRLSKTFKTAQKLSDVATKYNGQQLAHIQSSAATYGYYYEKVLGLADKMYKNDVSKSDAYSELKIQKLPPTEQAFFDDLVKAGRTQQAADFMGRMMVDRLNTVYGRNNAPQAWNSAYGKLAGGFGQWAAHQINTNIDVMTRGTRSQIIKSNLMNLATNAAIMSVGAYTGLNLSRWMITPWALPTESPLMAGLIGGVQNLENSTNLDPAISNPAVGGMKSYLPPIFGGDKWAHLYLPMSYFVQDLVDGQKMSEGNFGPSAAAKVMGFSTTNASVSPLQESMGLNPWIRNKQGNVVSVPHKGVGPNIKVNPFSQQ